MRTFLHDLRALMRLRHHLLLRLALARFTREAQRAAPARLVFILVLSFFGLLFLALAVSLVMLYGFPEKTARALIPNALAWGPSAAMVGIFFYSALTLVTRFTYRNDLSLLLLTPVSPRLVLAEKLFAVSGGFSLVMLVAMSPSVIGAGVTIHADPLYVPVALLMLVLLPMTPAALALLFVVAGLRWLPPARARIATAAIAMVLAGVIYVAVEAIGDRAVRAPSSRWSVLPTTWPGHAMLEAAAGHGRTSLVYIVATALLALVTVLLAVDRCAHLLTTGWGTYHEVGKRGHRHAVANPLRRLFPAAHVPSALARVRPLWWPLVQKEWLTFRRDPKLLAQLAYPLLIEGYSFYHAFGFPVRPHPILQGRVAQVFAGSLYISTTFTAVFLLSILTLPIISREGRSLYLLGLLPVRARHLLLAKWIFTAGPVLLVVEVLLIAVGAPLLQLSFSDTLFSAAVMAYLITALGGLLLCVALLWPRLGSDSSRRQVHAMALVVGPITGIMLCATVGGLLSEVYTPYPQHSWDPQLAGIGIFLITGLIIAGVALLGPRLLHELLIGDRRPA